MCAYIYIYKLSYASKKGVCQFLWFSMRCIFDPYGTVGNVWTYFWLSQRAEGEMGGSTGIKWLEAKDATNNSTIHKSASPPPIKEKD